MHFITFLEATKNGDGIFCGRFADEHGLEATLECGVFFNVLAVFIERCGANGRELTASELGLEQIRGIDSTFGRTSTDDGVKFIDEQNDLSV